MISPQPAATSVRQAEVVGSLSLVVDLAMGQPLEQGMRRALLAVWLGEELGDARLLDGMREMHSASAGEAAFAVLERARGFAGGVLADDATALVVDVRGS